MINDYMTVREFLTTKEKMMGVYSIKNTLSNKRYIGSSNDIQNRIKQHFTNLKKGKYIGDLQKDFTDHTENVFMVEVLELTPSWSGTMRDREDDYMKLFNTIENGYNKCLNGKTNNKVGITGYISKNIYEIIEKDIEGKDINKAEWFKEAILEKIVKEGLL